MIQSGIRNDMLQFSVRGDFLADRIKGFLNFVENGVVIAAGGV